MKKSESTDAERPFFAFLDFISFQVQSSAKNFYKKSFTYFGPKGAPTA